MNILPRNEVQAAGLQLVGRNGDYSVDIARTAITRAETEYFKPLIGIRRMGHTVQEMLSAALQALVNRDLDLVWQVVAEDDAVVKMWYAPLEEIEEIRQ